MNGHRRPSFDQGEHAILVLRCEGSGFAGEIIDQRWVRLRCKRTRCRKEGHRTYHIFDIFTGTTRTEHVPNDEATEET